MKQTKTNEIPEQLRKLWKIQYEPLEKQVLENVDKKTAEKYENMNWEKKVVVLDKVAAEIGL